MKIHWDIVLIAFFIAALPGIILYFAGVHRWGWRWLWDEIIEEYKKRHENRKSKRKSLQ